jgi:hypothetical protein
VITGSDLGGGGLNPGQIAPTAFYNTTNPVQSQFSWGQHGYQTGPTFNADLYNAAPGPVTPWGLQAMEQYGLTPEEIERRKREQATRAVAALSANQMPQAPVVAVSPYAPAALVK